MGVSLSVLSLFPSLMRAIYVRVRSTAVHLSRVLARQLPLPLPPRSLGRSLAELSLREYSYRAPEIGGPSMERGEEGS